LERFTKLTAPTENGCVLWVGCLNSRGYGCFRYGGVTVLAHRWAYEHIGGRDIPPGLTIDHLCREKRCVNPAHLEPVTGAVNTWRGTVGARGNACWRGHPFTAASEYVRPGGKRECRICRAARQREHYRQRL